MENICSLLKDMPALKDGIIIGVSKNGRYACTAYFIMGKEDFSKNCVFALDEDGLKINPFNSKKPVDPSLIGCYPIKTLGGLTIISNGCQTNAVFKHIKNGGSFSDALMSYSRRLDSEGFIPHISASFELTDTSFVYRMAIIKNMKNLKNIQLGVFEYPEPAAGIGHFIFTCRNDNSYHSSPLSEPIYISIGNSLTEFGDEIWDALDESDKISLFTGFTDIKTGRQNIRIINKNY